MPIPGTRKGLRFAWERQGPVWASDLVELGVTRVGQAVLIQREIPSEFSMHYYITWTFQTGGHSAQNSNLSDSRQTMGVIYVTDCSSFATADVTKSGGD